MKCEKCGNEYPSQYYFATPTICNDCFNNLPTEEQENYRKANFGFIQLNELAYRIGFGRRLGALVLDSLILAIVILIVFQANGFFASYMNLIEAFKENYTNAPLLAELQQQFFRENLSNFYFATILSVVYYSLEILIGASLGKLILGIQIAKAARIKADYGTLSIRFLIKNGAVVFSFLWLITGVQTFNTVNMLVNLALVVGFFFVLGQKRQGFHDMIAKTAVFRKNDISESQEDII